MGTLLTLVKELPGFFGMLCSYRELWFVQVVVLVVLRTLQRQLKSEALFGDLIHPDARCNCGCSRVCSAGATCLGGRICLRRTLPTGIEKFCQSRLRLERKDHAIVFH